MAAQVQQRLHHLQVALVDSDVQWRLTALVPGVEVGAAPLEHLDDGALVSEGRMVHSPVTILVLKMGVVMVVMVVVMVVMVGGTKEYRVSHINQTRRADKGPGVCVPRPDDRAREGVFYKCVVQSGPV